MPSCLFGHILNFQPSHPSPHTFTCSQSRDFDPATHNPNRAIAVPVSCMSSCRRLEVPAHTWISQGPKLVTGRRLPRRAKAVLWGQVGVWLISAWAREHCLPGSWAYRGCSTICQLSHKWVQCEHSQEASWSKNLLLLLNMEFGLRF